MDKKKTVISTDEKTNNKKHKNDTDELLFRNFHNSYFCSTINKSKICLVFIYHLFKYLLGINLYCTRHYVFFLWLTLLPSAAILLWRKSWDWYSVNWNLGHRLDTEGQSKTIKVSCHLGLKDNISLDMDGIVKLKENRSERFLRHKIT